MQELTRLRSMRSASMATLMLYQSWVRDGISTEELAIRRHRGLHRRGEWLGQDNGEEGDVKLIVSLQSTLLKELHTTSMDNRENRHEESTDVMQRLLLLDLARHPLDCLEALHLFARRRDSLLGAGCIGPLLLVLRRLGLRLRRSNGGRAG